MRFEITAIRTECKCEDVFAETKEDAAKLFREKHPTFRIEDVFVVTDYDEEEGKIISEGWTSAGQCEGCSVELWCEEDYVLDMEGEMNFCIKCGCEPVST